MDKVKKIKRGWSISEPSFNRLVEIADSLNLSQNKTIEKLILLYDENNKHYDRINNRTLFKKCSIKYGEGG